MGYFLNSFLVITLIFGVFSCSKDKGSSVGLSSNQGPSVSEVSHTGTVTDFTEKKGIDLDLSKSGIQASIKIDDPTFYYAVPAENCRGRVFTQYLEGTRVEMKSGVMTFSYHPNATPQDNLSSAIALKTFHKITLLNEEGTKVTKTVFVDLMAKENHIGEMDFLKSHSFFCDDSGELYLATMQNAVYESAPNSGYYLVKERDIKLLRFFHVDTSSTIAKIKEKRTLSNFHPQKLIVEKGKIYGTSLDNGTMFYFRLALPDFTPEVMKFIRLHDGNDDRITDLHLGSEGNLYAIGNWRRGPLFTLEMIKFDQDLNALPEIVTDNAGSGRDGYVDLIAQNKNILTVLDSTSLKNDLLLATIFLTRSGPQKHIVAIDKNTGDLDLGFHKTGIEYFPTNSLLMKPLKNDEMILMAYASKDNLGIRLMDSEGKIIKLNGEEETILTKNAPLVKDIQIIDGRNAIIYYAESGQKDLLGYVKVSLEGN